MPTKTILSLNASAASPPLNTSVAETYWNVLRGPRYRSRMLLLPSSGTLWLPNQSVAEFTFPTRRVTSWIFLAAMTAASPSAG